MRTNDALTRRGFLRQTSLGAAALAAGTTLARANSTATTALDRIGIGLIGAGDRGTYLLRELLALKGNANVQVTAVCDVWKRNREAAIARVKQDTGAEPKALSRFADLLAFPDVDAVIIATPDFSHAPILLAALEAGKDVYIEKPMTIDIPSANRALDLARAKSRIVQVGTQRRSDGQFRGAAKLVSSGVLGKINRISAAMNVNQARWVRRFDDCRSEDVDWEAFCLGQFERPFDARLLRCWQLFRLTSNGMPGLWMTHYVDAVHLVTGARYPAAAVALGSNYVWRDGREHPDTFHALLDYSEGFLLDWGMGLGNSAGVHFTMHGTKGTLDLERWTHSAQGAASDATATKPPPARVPAEPSVGHMENWVQCLRSRQAPNADIAFGHQHTVATVMAAAALQSGRRQTYDAETRQMSEG